MYLVPFVEDEQTIFLKTIIPSRKATKQYFGEESDDELDADEKDLLERRPSHVEGLRQTADVEQRPATSPDGCWMAYGSMVSGRDVLVSSSEDSRR